LQSQGFVDSVVANSKGVSYPAINPSELVCIPVSYPENKNEQQAIAGFLDRKTGQIDELIGKKKELIKKLNEQRSALITHVVTKGLDATVPMKDSGAAWLGKVPKHWDVRRMKFLTKVIGGGTPSTGNSKYWNGDIPWVSPKDMKSDLIDSAQDNITELGATESATKIVQPNTVLVVVRSGILRHTIPVARNTVPVALNQDMKGFTPENGLIPEYLHLLIAGNQKQLLPLWSKPGCTVESLEVELMMNTEIPAPPVSEQQAVAEYLDEKTGRIDGLIQKTETAIQTLEEYRTALITAAVTGKVKVV
jgi:restriction endonuclease S subunit